MVREMQRLKCVKIETIHIYQKEAKQKSTLPAERT